jgi:hypothetical protein
MKKADLDLYTDYLLSTFGAATATGLSAMIDGDVRHEIKQARLHGHLRHIQA